MPPDRTSRSPGGFSRKEETDAINIALEDGESCRQIRDDPHRDPRKRQRSLFVHDEAAFTTTDEEINSCFCSAEEQRVAAHICDARARRPLSESDSTYVRLTVDLNDHHAAVQLVITPFNHPHFQKQILFYPHTVTKTISSLGEAKIRVIFATISFECVGNPSPEFPIFDSLLSCFSYFCHQIPGGFLA